MTLIFAFLLGMSAPISWDVERACHKPAQAVDGAWAEGLCTSYAYGVQRACPPKQLLSYTPIPHNQSEIG